MNSLLQLKKTENSIFSVVISISRPSVSADLIILHIRQCMSVCCFSLFFRQKYTHSPFDIITPSIRVYFQMSGTCPEECHTTSAWILDKEGSIGPAIQAILRLLIKTRQCCRLLDSNRMFSAHCQWRLQLKKCWTNRSSPTIMNNFHFYSVAAF